VRTLRNAVEQGKVHHAYLFVGSRGTGKTSMAKILAACLNCERGPTIEPCGVCESCTSIASATSLDVIEMDAASNNSVDDIRELRDKVAYAPVSGRHKVYILDEAHMLSTQAWNAFLKTLEEPPPNTIFVLATTEAQKVLPTVVDRCHRFDFARPSADQVAEVLARVAQAEGIELPDAARALIARKATGSFRDALGNLEQLVTYGGPQVSLDDVLAVLGVADAELLFECCDAVGEGDVARALRAIARLSDSGRDAGRFVRDLEEHARGLLVAQALGEVPPELRVTPEQDARMTEQAGRLGRAEVVRLLDLLAAAMEALKAGADARTQLELAVVKAAAPDLDPSSKALLSRIERLESQLAAGGGGPVRAVSTTPVAPAAGEAPAPAPPRSEPQNAAVVGAAAVAVALEPDGDIAVEAAVGVATVAQPEAQSEPDVAALTPLDLEAILSIWPAVIETVRGQNAMLAALLEGANPVEVATDEIKLAFAESAAFLKRKAEGVANREAVAQALRDVTGRPLRLVYELRAEVEGDDAAAPKAAPLSAEDWVSRVMSEFDAEELPPEGEQPAQAAVRTEGA
jgi:DNA polymerase-3 subunit gamma/tau